MARINCDPYEGGHLFVLVDRVTCLFDGEDEAMAAVQALEQDGVATGDIDVFMGEQGAECLDLSGRRHGRAIRLLRTLEDAVTDMGETSHRIEAAVRGGASLLTVKLHKKPLIHQDANGGIHFSVFERSSDERARVLRVLKALRPHEIHYWGTWSVEDLASG